jgi:hypothetical protein
MWTIESIRRKLYDFSITIHFMANHWMKGVVRKYSVSWNF